MCASTYCTHDFAGHVRACRADVTNAAQMDVAGFSVFMNGMNNYCTVAASSEETAQSLPGDRLQPTRRKTCWKSSCLFSSLSPGLAVLALFHIFFTFSFFSFFFLNLCLKSPLHISFFTFLYIFFCLFGEKASLALIKPQAVTIACHILQVWLITERLLFEWRFISGASGIFFFWQMLSKWRSLFSYSGFHRWINKVRVSAVTGSLCFHADIC